MARRWVGIWLLAILATVTGVLWSSADPSATSPSQAQGEVKRQG